jgi:hypothetical protein
MGEMRWQTIPLIALIVLFTFAVIFVYDSCKGDGHPKLVHVDRVEPLCEHAERRAIKTLRTCEDVTEMLKTQLAACRRAP